MPDLFFSINIVKKFEHLNRFESHDLQSRHFPLARGRESFPDEIHLYTSSITDNIVSSDFFTI